ncbi:hypothetical protein [Propionicimonas sp. T2.31MG-18]|uniref:hypothetical protein n=1 Tax=Propionicimonas sp. T2.31MG-18 TaxID=3157620 RepID=UPI003672C6C5
MKKHEEHNITLLCPTHHQHKTSGRLSTARVQAQSLSPHNSGRQMTGQTSNYYDLSHLSVGFSTVRIVSDLIKDPARKRVDAINVDGGTVFGVRKDATGHLGLMVRLCTRDNLPFLLIRNGEMRISTGVWDASMSGSRLILRNSGQRVLVEMKLDPTDIELVRGDFWANGYHFTVTNQQGLKNENDDFFVSGVSLEGAGCAFFAGERIFVPSPVFMFGSHNNRFGLSRDDPGLQAFAKIRAMGLG